MSPEKPDLEKSEKRPGQIEGMNPRVLYAEDDPDIRTMMEGYLRSKGFKVESVSNGKALLEKMSANGGGYDIILTDYNMPPEMRGTEAVENIRNSNESWRNIPVVILTGTPDETTERAAKEFGVVCMTKPPNFATLADRLKEVVESKKVSQAVQPEQKKEMPLSWFIGFGVEARGITSILFSKEFNDLGGQEFQDAIAQYGHHMGNTMVDSAFVTDSSQIPDAEIRNRVQEAEKVIGKVTRILIAEDNKTMRNLLVNSFTAFGYTVEAVESGEELLQKLVDMEYDLVITDNNMKGEMKGIEALRQIRAIEKTKNLSVILMTTNFYPELVAEIIRFNGKGFKKDGLLVDNIKSRIKELEERQKA